MTYTTLLLDADALIKLNRIGALTTVTQVFKCVIPDAVYDEAVIAGIETGRADAAEIDNAVQNAVAVQSVSGGDPRLGRGEGALMVLSESEAGSIIVSDDRMFLSYVSRSGRPYLTPASLLSYMVLQGYMAVEQAKGFLERLRPLTSLEAYSQALHGLGGQYGLEE